MECGCLLILPVQLYKKRFTMMGEVTNHDLTSGAVSEVCGRVNKHLPHRINMIYNNKSEICFKSKIVMSVIQW